MPVAQHIATNFTSGVLSPRLYGRVDLSKYNNGCKTLSNMLIHPHGGVSKRGGTYYVATSKTSGKKVRLVSFEYSTTQTYILEFGENYIRFFKDQAAIVSGTPVEVVTTYTEAELFELQFAQSADTLYIVHKDHIPATLTRSSHTSWSLANISFTWAAASPWGAADYPQSVCFYEQRLIFASIPSLPQTLWGSKSGDYDNFDVGSAAADDAWSYTIATENVNAIRWLSPGQDLVIGTTGGEFIATGGTDEAITPTNIRIVRRSTYGSAEVAPQRVSDVVLYTQRAKRKIRQFSYEFATDSYVSPDLTLLSEHITQGDVVSMAYQQEPLSILWVVLGNGKLIGLTYQRDQEVVGWHEHVVGGVSDASDNDAIVEDVAVIPGADGTGFDEVWVSVKRYVNSATVRHIEVLQSGLDDDEALSDAFFVDAGLTGTITGTTVSGLDHLEGQVVSVLVGGATHPDKTVASGAITLDYSVTSETVHVGLSYNADIELLAPEAGSADGTAQGKTKRISEVILRLYRTVGALVGTSATALDRIPWRSSADAMDSPVGLFTGDKHIAHRGGYDTQGNVYIRQNQALPFQLNAVILKLKTND